MVVSSIKFGNQLTPCEPPKESVLIFGKRNVLVNLEYDELKVKFGPKVTKQVYDDAIETFKTTSSEVVPLYLKAVTLISIPSTCSRHNTPSQAHYISKQIRSHTSRVNEHIVIACEYRDALASACAITRSFPLFIRKLNGSDRSVKVEFIIVDGKGRSTLSDEDIECISAASRGIRIATTIVDTPCNEMNTDAFVREIRNVGDILGIVPVVISGDELKERGFGGVYNVGKAAEHGPALAILSHIVPGAKESIAWVGKGIVYDTGGLFLKSRTSMPGMKRDCAGAAAVLGAFYVAVKLGFKENLHAIFCLAENAIGPLATRPDDVITLYSGKTVEVSNTDAEGRLVLGDGCSYAKKDLKATTIVDIATLTGAQGTATGRYHGAVLTNSEESEKAAVSAGRISGDLLHPVIYAPEMHFQEYNSGVADMKNSVADGSNAAVSCAGLFIGSHIGFDYDGRWIHIDFAKPSIHGERSTGYGVALLPTLFGSASKNPMLQKLSSHFERGDGLRPTV